MQPIFLAFGVALFIGLPIAVILILIGRKRGWFEEGLTKYQLSQKLDEVFLGRQRLDPESFYTLYFASTGVPKDIPIRVREIIEEHINADFSRLRDDDDFSQNLKCLWDYDSLAAVEIVQSLEEEFGMSISDEEASRMKTIKNIVDIIWQKKIALDATVKR